MTAVVSFALDCAASGRWMRGLIALGDALYARDDAHTRARLALARVAAAHDSWHVALSLLRDSDVTCALPSASTTTTTTTQQQQSRVRGVCAVLDTVARSRAVPSCAYTTCVIALLRAATAAPQRDTSTEATTTRTTNTTTRHTVATTVQVPDEALRTQRALFLAATRWASYGETRALYSELHSPCAQCTVHMQAMTQLHTTLQHTCGMLATTITTTTTTRTDGGYKDMADDVHSTALATATRQRAHACWSRRQPLRGGRAAREQAALQRRVRHAAAVAAHAQTRQHIVAALQPRPSAVSVAWLLRTATLYAPDVAPVTDATTATVVTTRTTRTGATALPPLRVSWRDALAAVATRRLTHEVAYVYARCVGLCAPHLWLSALRALAASSAAQQHAGQHGDVCCSSSNNTAGTTTPPPPPLYSMPLLQLWLCSRGSWRAAATLYTQQQQQQQYALSSSWLSLPPCCVAADILARTAMPPSAHRRLCTLSSPSLLSRQVAHQRLTRPSTRALARLLASGVPLEDVHLRPLATRWATHGQWRACLLLYARLPTRRLQRATVQALVHACGGSGVTRHSSNNDEKSNNDGDAAKAAARHDATATAHMSAETALHLLLSVLSRVRRRHAQRQCDDDNGDERRSNAHTEATLTTRSVCELMRVATSWQAALRVFRTSVKHGTSCTSPMLHTLLEHHALPCDEVRRLLHSYAAAVDERARRAARQRCAAAASAQ